MRSSLVEADPNTLGAESVPLALEASLGDDPAVANNSADEKPLEAGAFVVHATRGVIRGRSSRRKMMIILLALALFLLVAGSTFLSSMLNPRAHLVLALIFWIACVWFTITALLLALFDLAAVRREARREQRELKRSYASVIESNDKRDGNPRSP